MDLGIRVSRQSRPLITHPQGLGRRLRRLGREHGKPRMFARPGSRPWSGWVGIFADELSGMTSGEGPDREWYRSTSDED